MTKEDKDLLLRDLSARLPYDTIISVNDGKYRKDVKLHPHYIFDWDAERWDAKPYLRPIPSMTEKEQSEFVEFHCVNLCPIIVSEMLTILQESKMLDWLNSHHFDYRGLIEKGLALEAPKDMYDLNNESR